LIGAVVDESFLPCCLVLIGAGVDESDAPTKNKKNNINKNAKTKWQTNKTIITKHNGKPIKH